MDVNLDDSKPEGIKNYTDDDYANAALLLSRTYPAMKSERENIRAWQEGERKYTEEDALEELISITGKNDEQLGIRVQTSGISDPTGDIATLLADGYVEKKQKERIQELFSAEMLEYIDYLDWKIDIVETAMAERMTKLQQGIYKRHFFKNYSYSQLIKSHKGKKLNNWKISREKEAALEAVATEIEFAAGLENGTDYMEQLITEVLNEQGE